MRSAIKWGLVGTTILLALSLFMVNFIQLSSDTVTPGTASADPIQPQTASESVQAAGVFDTISEFTQTTLESQKQRRASSERRRAYQAQTEETITQQIKEEGKSRVIVKLKDTTKRSAVEAKLGSNVKLRDLKRGLVVEATDSAITELMEDPNVESVAVDRQVEVAWDHESFSLIKLNETIDLAGGLGIDVTGAGQTVCVVDSGLEGNHGAFNNENYLSYGTKVAYGYDYWADHPDWDDGNGHGTGVAGVIAGNSASYTGMLPDAKIAVMKVTDDVQGIGWESYIDEAVNDCVDNRTKFNITTIVIPLRAIQAAPWTPNDCIGDPGFQAIEAALAAGMNVIAPTGNDARADTIGFPAVCEGVTSVAGVWDHDVVPGAYDTFWNNSNRHTQDLDLLAPAESVYGPGLNDQYAQGSGTSQAAAMVTGAYMILEEIYQDWYGLDLNSTEIRDILKLTGEPINDTEGTKVNYPRLNIEAAANYETFLPTITLQTADNAWSDTSVELKYSVDDQHHDISECRIFVNGNLNGTNASVTETVSDIHEVTLSGGSHTWYVECDDTATVPNTRTSATYTINVDTVAPDINLIAPTDGHVENISNKINFSFSVNDTNNIDSCELNIDTITVDAIPSPTKGSQHTFAEQTLANGGHTWYVRCADEFGNMQTLPTYTLTMNVPTEPTLSGIPDQQTNEDTTPPSNWIDLHNYAADPDNATPELSFSITSQSNAALISCSIVSDQFVNCGTPAADQNGTNNITVEVTDGVDTDTDSFIVSVIQVNDPPAVGALPNQNLLENSGDNQDVIDIAAFVTDPDGPATPTCAVISETNPGVVNCTVDGADRLDCDVQPGQTGSSTVTIEVTDTLNTSTQNVVVTVGNVNDPPTLSGVPDVDTNEDTTPPSQWIDLWSYAADPDNTSSELDFSIASQSNSALILCSVVSDQYFECNTPSTDQFGTSDVNISVTDGEFTDYDMITVTVNSVNDVPTLSGLPNPNLMENSGDNQDLFNAETYAGDVETAVGSLTYTIVAETDTSVVDCSIDGSNNLDCVVQAGQTGSSDVTLNVSDGEDSAQDTFTVDVSALPNNVPVITNLPANGSGDEGQYYSFDVDADDPDNDTLSWTILNPETGMSIDSNGLFEWTPDHSQSGVYNVNIKVDDGKGGEDTETLTVTVNDVPLTIDYSLDFLLVQSGSGTQNQIFSYLVKNMGTQDITSFDYLFWDGVEANYSDTVVPATPIAAGKTYVGMISVAYTITGSGNAELTIDPLNTVAELDENNNQQTVGVTVS